MRLLPLVTLCSLQRFHLKPVGRHSSLFQLQLDCPIGIFILVGSYNVLLGLTMRPIVEADKSKLKGGDRSSLFIILF
jgi:hypothetical protein